MNASHPADEAGVRDLAAAVIRGEAAALDRWYRWEHPQVYRLCLGFLADATEADDLAQDAMLHLLDRLDRWDRQRPYQAWRNTVVLNLSRDRRRRLAARRAAEERAEERSFPQRLPRPDEAAHRAEVRSILARTLEALSPREREAFVLRDLEGLDTAEAAEAMGVTGATVRSLLTLARRRLRNLLGKRLPELAPEAGGGRA